MLNCVGKTFGMKQIILFLSILSFFTTGCSAGDQPETHNGLASRQIIKTIDKGKPVIIKGKIIADDLDFTKIKNQVIFSSSQLIATVDVPVTFIGCIFMGKVTTNGISDKYQVTTHFERNLTFEACDFRGDANFDNSTIDGMVNFTGAVFRENAMFNNVTFRGRQNYFTAFTAEKLFSMQESKTEGAIDFFKGKVTGKLTFQSTEFCGTARFSNLACSGKSEFSLTVFRSNTQFNYAGFGDDFRMANTDISGKLDMVSVVFQRNALLTNSVFSGKVDFTGSEARAGFDLSGSLFTLGKPVMDKFTVQKPGQIITTGTKFANFTEFSAE